MRPFKFLRKYIIREEYGETEDFEIHRVSRTTYDPSTFVPIKITFYRHRTTGEIVRGQIIHYGDPLWDYPSVEETA